MTNKIKTPPEDRIYDDDDGFFLRAASVCVKDNNESEILLVNSHSKPGHWIIPGGKIQANEDPGTSAAREAMEEAGARGRLGRSLGTFDNPDMRPRTTVFVLHVDDENGGLVDDFEEKDHRLRKWFPIEEAKSVLAKPLHAKYLSALQATSSLLHIPSSKPKSDPIVPISTNTTKQPRGNESFKERLPRMCTTSSCSVSNCEKINRVSCADNHLSGYGCQKTRIIQSATAPVSDGNGAYHVQISPKELSNSANLQVANGIQTNGSVPTTNKSATAAAATGLLAS